MPWEYNINYLPVDTVWIHFTPGLIFRRVVLVAMNIRFFDLIEINLNRLNPGIGREDQNVILRSDRTGGQARTS